MYLVEVKVCVNADAQIVDSLLKTLLTHRQRMHVQVSCVRSGQKSCLIEHSRLIILRNDSDSTFPRISLHYEYGGDSKLSALQDVVLALDGSGSQLSRVSPMAASKVRSLWVWIYE